MSADTDAPGSVDAPAEKEAPRPPSRFRRFAPLLLVAGAGLAGATMMPHVPHERTVELRLDDAAGVTRVDLAWDDARAGDAALQGGSWRFPAGAAPSSLRTVVRLPDGKYDLDVTVERGPERRAFHRTITLGDSERITVPLR